MIRDRFDEALLFARTAKNLRASQVLHRIRLRAQRWPPMQPIVSALLSRARPTGRVPGWPNDFLPLDLRLGEGCLTPEQNSSGRFGFLNEERQLGSPLDWSQADASRLWRFHLHYFDWAWAFACHHDRVWGRAAFSDLWQSWNESVALGHGDEWSPYVVSLRAWALCGVYDALVADTDIDRELVVSLARHASFLRWHVEHDVGGNHLIKNLKALVGLGIFLGNEDTVRMATRHLRRQLSVQILSDGGHYERSPSYHCQVLGDLIDVAGLLDAAGRPHVPGLAEAVEAMRIWLGLMLMPDGDVPLFNDCVLVGCARLALLEPGPPAAGPLTVLSASGYVVMRPGDRLHLVADVGDPCPPDLPGHAHADCLSFQASVDGCRVLVDVGTSTYEPGAQRAHERSTDAHNTVSVDSADQTVVWGIFRAAQLAQGRLERAEYDDNAVTVTATHDGYRRLTGKPVHRRTWRVSPTHFEITDDILGSGSHQIQSNLHFSAPTPFRVTWSGPADLVVTETNGHFATGFGVVQEGPVVSAAWHGGLPVTIQAQLHLDPLAASHHAPSRQMVAE